MIVGNSHLEWHRGDPYCQLDAELQYERSSAEDEGLHGGPVPHMVNVVPSPLQGDALKMRKILNPDILPVVREHIVNDLIKKGICTLDIIEVGGSVSQYEYDGISQQHYRDA